ncbi:MAG: C40 family peptidase [Firmicutes bacterium]|nr:C40 family peptidase [Bacillota bacterium]
MPLAVLWTEPGPKREYDRSILGAGTDPAAWAAGMDPEMRLWLVGKAETQALYGERLAVLERRGDWLKVAAVAQKTRLNHLGYPGWLPAVQVQSDPSYLRDQEAMPEVAISVPGAVLYRDPALREASIEVGYQTRLPLLAEEEKAVRVRLPDGGTGYIERDKVKKTGELSFSGSGIVREARRFLGINYLWAGASPYGFDCSGFTMRLYQSQGISIPRDADDQAQEGVPVAREDLAPGDLLFFAAKGGRGQIHHVGLYSGNGMMIHAPNSRSAVREEPFDSGVYGEEYWGARRYHP